MVGHPIIFPVRRSADGAVLRRRGVNVRTRHLTATELILEKSDPFRSSVRHRHHDVLTDRH